jgi:hypothetical protein
MSLLSRIAVEAARGFGLLSASDKTKVSASYLAVAGGGGSGSNGGGGGAGGYLSSTATLSTLNTYSITVGAGGTNVVGSNSVISGTGLTTITATGGGYGATDSQGTGGNGGSGGGGNYNVTAGSASPSGQGNNGGTGQSTGAGNNRGGGGGGSSAVGANATSSAAGIGGAGTANSISGSSVTYAGGGGGYANGAGTTAGNGGSGGGGAGGVALSATGGTGTLNGANGTVNTGGGGGGSGNTGANTIGGSGIVIISYTSATPKFVGGTLTTINSGATQVHTFTSSGTLSPLTPVTASYLVVAGGGGGGSNLGGGGGAGGLLTSSITLYSGATYVVTVGAGGAGGAYPADNNGVNGSNSVLSGTGLTTLTSIGGGGGGKNAAGLPNAGSGGSGGGCGEGVTNFGTGTSGQGNNGGQSYDSGGAYGAGGGGGAGAVGSNGTTSSGGAGGVGSASSISGTSTYYAGGGGGAGIGTAGAGGNGGGGAGASSGAGVSGTPNTGGGAGASASSTAGAAGGSGTVIISYAGSQVFNGGLVTSSGGNTIHTFNATGALTPLTNNLNNSLRFRASASAYLLRTPTIASNQKTWTWSAWVKRGLISSTQTIFGAYPTDGFSFRFQSDDTIRIYDYTGAFNVDLRTTQVFRDPSAWYHLVLIMDTTQATAANRVRLYLNGNQITAFGTATYPTQNANLLVNSLTAHDIGRDAYAGSYFDGYMTDINFIDGQALEPYYFGNNDAYGNWKPIKYTGMYGTNGFYLTFGNTTSTTTLGYDSSPNGNNWTTNNISLTAGSTYDAMLDVPTNTSATVANYPTLNPLSNTSTLTEANLSASNILLAGATMATPSTGKWYFEYTQTTSIPSGSLWVGVSSNTNAVADNQLQGYSYASDGRKVAYNSYTSGYGSTWTNGDVIGCALDLDNQTITFYKNNTSQGTAFTSITAQPYVFALSAGGAASTKGGSINCGQRPFSYTPPTGFVALNTYNLPTPTILQGNKYMDASLWTSNAAASQVIVNQGQFKPDFIWAKNRSASSIHILSDSVRGVLKHLSSNDTTAEAADDAVQSFNNNGFTSGTWLNTSTNNFVGWQWQAGQGTTSSNTSGSITSTVSVNTTAGFSIVTYTGTGSNATCGHGLGVIPSMVIWKNRTATDTWIVYHSALTTSEYLVLASTAAKATYSGLFTGISSTLLPLNAASAAINASANNYVAYCWSQIAGFSKFGSYTGNGSTDGTFVYLGFRPKFVIFKRTDSTGTWGVWDTSRDTYNAVQYELVPNASDAESAIARMDILSNGFKLRNTGIAFNASGGTYIYMAFAENPFKNSNAR